jgi:heme exporter protein A
VAETLTASKLSLIRGDRCLFQDVDFALNSGELLFVAGANGSGKTSLLRAIAGLLDFESGQISWNGAPVEKGRQQFRASLVWFAHRIGFKGDLTPQQNLKFEAGLRAFRGVSIRDALARVGVEHCADLPMRVLSAGQQRRVGLARLILADAPLWMMDEPFTNLDSDGQALVSELITEHLADGGICAVASHQPITIDAPTQRIVL